ncbi:uncharacterized protein LOC124425603 isoform X1 [Vespa crabro]|uniref:uncharacterized protein LOC124425603 isoform X1 n=2 Tax=Vespa crabro TaxID=7445 RepID=UPI001F025EA4|nr:uncharacterized protein LOC124425603 isoform X1 [Vespa crabro]
MDFYRAIRNKKENESKNKQVVTGLNVMQGLTFPRRKGRFTPSSSSSSLLVLLLLPLAELPLANGSCEFPASWAGEWYQHGKPVPIIINATMLGERKCVERRKDKFITYGDKCYHCMIITARHENVIQYREGFCNPDPMDLENMCSMIGSDDILYSMFRINSKPIPCPFSGPPFTFSYNRGYRECAVPISLAERCTDESKLLLKYQACPDIDGTESNTEELQCLAVWNDGGRNKYLVGTLKGRNAVANEITFRCFLYEEKHHQGKVVYMLAHSGEPTCNGLTTVSEASLTIKLTKVDKEHSRCKYPSWVTQHHDWHSLDGTKMYHFTNKNATLKVKAQETDREAFHEEKIVCHNLEKMHPNDNMQGHKVKLIAHVTSGCDIGYVCMIFHKRDGHIIEIQQSAQKAIMPDEVCSLWDPSNMPYTTLITSFLHQRKCSHAGRYSIMDFAPSNVFSDTPRRQRRSEKSSKTAKRRTWQDDIEDEECRSTDIQIGCSSSDQNEMVIANTCEHEEKAYSCHGSWEEKGIWYTIVSQKSTELRVGLGQTYCFSMRPGTNPEKSQDRSKSLQQEQELWLSKPTRFCQRNGTNEWTYRLSSQGVCEDLMKAASSLASTFSLSSSTIIVTIVTTTHTILSR